MLSSDLPGDGAGALLRLRPLADADDNRADDHHHIDDYDEHDDARQLHSGHPDKLRS
jgi:hypothetical protein